MVLKQWEILITKHSNIWKMITFPSMENDKQVPLELHNLKMCAIFRRILFETVEL